MVEPAMSYTLYKAFTLLQVTEANQMLLRIFIYLLRYFRSNMNISNLHIRVYLKYQKSYFFYSDSNCAAHIYDE